MRWTYPQYPLLLGILLYALPTANSAGQHVGIHFDENGRYRFHRTFEASDSTAQVLERALAWADRKFASTEEAIVERDISRGRFVATGTFIDRFSDVSDIIHFRMEFQTRPDGFSATYDSFVYQAGPTHHAHELELGFAERPAAISRTQNWLRQEMAELMILAEAPSSLTPPLDLKTFTLAFDGNSHRLERMQSPVGDVQAAWLAPPENPEEDAPISPRSFHKRISAFAIGDGSVGLHLSSFEPAGSGDAEEGRDVFLILNPKDGSLRDGQLALGITKARGRDGDCSWALSHRFLVGDVDGDRLTDVGMIREELNCLDPGDLIGHPRGYPVKWFVFTGPDWEYRPEHDDKLPVHTSILPLIGIDETPVESVLRIIDRR